MINYYQTLGIDQDATPDQIKRAYRKLASQHHPDKGGDKNKFQEIQGAYDTLSDPQKRAQHDNPRPQFNNMNMGGQGFDFQTIFDVFGTRFQQPHQQQRVQQARMTLWVTLPDVAVAGKKTISVGTHLGTMTVEIEMPPGLDDNDTVQYPGIGPGGMDLLITFRIHPTPQWERQGPNLITEQITDVWSLIMGTELQVRDILGSTLSLAIPPRTQPGTMFRLRGRGLTQRSGPAGDLLVRVQATIPKDIPENVIDAIRQIQAQ
jgi:DnaJ-class molecular chaperone